ncbi:MAG: hypothetical protein QXP55_01140 [Nitrososphaerales archaeon]
MIEIRVEIVKRKNQTLIDAKPMIRSTFQKSATIVVQVATILLNADLSEADVIFNIDADVSNLDGSSSGAVMTTLVCLAITGMTINQSVMVA